LEDTPSRFRRMCEEALISTGLYTPKVRAEIVESGYTAESLNGHYVLVQLPKETKKRIFTYTNRDAFELAHQMIFPVEFLDPQRLRGLKVVDLACGEGRMVEDLRRQDVDVVGLDVHLSTYQKSKPYFVQASMDRTPFADKSVDVLMSSMGPIRYALNERDLIVRTLNEAHRILKTGGVFRISPLELDDLIPLKPASNDEAVQEKHYFHLQAVFGLTGARPETDLRSTGLWPLPPGWRIKSFPTAGWFHNAPSDIETRGPYYWLELERID